MAFSYVPYQGNGIVTEFSVPFPYLVRAHVRLYYGLNFTTGGYTNLLVDGIDYNWISGTQVRLVTAPPSGTTLTIRRETPTTSRLVDWNDGSTLNAADLDTADLQNFYAIQEHRDYIEAYTFSPSANLLPNSITSQMLSAGVIDSDSKVAENAGISSSKLAFLQSGLSAVSRTAQSKLREMVSVKDFGATGDGVTDDTAAIQAAINAQGMVRVPPGNYKLTSTIILSASYQGLIGDEERPNFYINPSVGPAVAIRAPANSNIVEFCVIRDINFWATGFASYSASPGATNCGIAVDGSPSTFSHPIQRARIQDCRVIGFSCGVSLARHVNTRLENVIIQDYSPNWTGNAGLASLTSSNLFVGVNFSAEPFAVGGISPNASCEVVNVLVDLAGSPLSITTIGFRITGTDPRDIFFSRCETVGGNYGFFIQPTNSAFNIDIQISRPIIDACDTAGIYVKNWNGHGALNINGGYLLKNTIKQGAHMWIENSAGVSVVGVQFIGVTNNTNQDDGVRLKSCNSVSITGCLFVNNQYGISLEDSSYCSIVGNTINAAATVLEPAPTLGEAIRLWGTSSRNCIASNTIKGASSTYRYTNGIRVDSTCNNNFVALNTINTTEVINPLVINDVSTQLINQNGDGMALSGYSMVLTSRYTQMIIQGNDATYPILFRNGSGSSVAGITNAGALVSLSDRRLKENIQEIDCGLNEILGLRPVRFNMAEDPSKLPLVGLIAQETLPVLPAAVMEIEGNLAIDYSSLIPVLIKAVQELYMRM